MSIRSLALRIMAAALIAAAWSPTIRGQHVEGHLRGGEFRAAAGAAAGLANDARDEALAEVAVAQAASGDSVASSATAREIVAAGPRQRAVETASAAAAGGGVFADFDSLMQLIQTTVVPDTWEALGGPSTMAPYAQGIYVDPAGTVRVCESDLAGDGIADLEGLLGSPPGATRAVGGRHAWRAASSLRCVSLRRLLDEITSRRISRAAWDDAMRFLAGISTIRYVLLTETDVLLAGPVGGVVSQGEWLRDRESGRSPVRLEILANCLRASLSAAPFGCTIDPTREGLRRAAEVASRVGDRSLPIGKAAESMREALGMQRVDVFGTAADTPLAYLMVEADRHMKRLALGTEPLPRGVDNYLDAVDAKIADGPPNRLLLRLWFTGEPVRARANAERTAFELAGRPLRLSGKNRRAVPTGDRGNVVADPRTEMFVAEFNQHWGAIRDAYPIYGALEAVFRAASVAELVRRHGASEAHRELIESLASLATRESIGLRAPAQVESIAVVHSVRHADRRHRILIASGGVAVDPGRTLASEVADYPALDSLTGVPDDRPKVHQRWWWDVEGGAER